MIGKARSDAVTIQLLLIAFVALTIISSWILAQLYGAVPHAAAADPSILIERYRVYLSPKPEEKTIFLSLAALVPFLGFVVSLRVFGDIERPELAEWRQIILPIATSALFLFPFLRFDFGQSLLTGSLVPGTHPLRVLAASLTGSLVWFGWRALRKPQMLRRHAKGFTRFVWAIFAGSVALQIGAWRLVSENSIDNSADWNASADAVLYTIAQVSGGKTLLSDLPSQYGLYPEMLAPFFRVVGLSLLSFSSLCAILQILSMAAIVSVLQKEVREPALRIAALLAFVMVTFETCLWLLNVGERYFQYWPVRFFWPAISVFAFYRYSKSRTLGRAALVSLVAAIGALWNADSGLMIVIAFAAVMATKWLFLYFSDRFATARQRAHVALALLLHGLIFCVATAGFFAYLAIKATQPLHWSWLFAYQKLFYGLGFAMLPLPLSPHPWMLVLGVYLAGFFVACAGISRRPNSSSLDNVLFLSLLGLGMFVYYEGRSHVLNLITVSWPSVLLGAILSDRVIRGVRSRQLSRASLALPVCALGILSYCATPFVTQVPRLMSDALHAYESRHQPQNAAIAGDLRFLREHSQRGDECMVLSLRQGVYEVETGLVSPVSGPGYGETLLQSDINSMIGQLRERLPSCLFVGVGPTSAIDLAGNKLDFLDHYRLVATSESGTMSYYRRY